MNISVILFMNYYISIIISISERLLFCVRNFEFVCVFN